jgi:hypothetical protein
LAIDLPYNGNRFGRRRLHFSPTYQRKRFLDRGRSVHDTRQFHANGGFESDGVRDLDRARAYPGRGFAQRPLAVRGARRARSHVRPFRMIAAAELDPDELEQIRREIEVDEEDELE